MTYLRCYFPVLSILFLVGVANAETPRTVAVLPTNATASCVDASELSRAITNAGHLRAEVVKDRESVPPNAYRVEVTGTPDALEIAIQGQDVDLTQRQRSASCDTATDVVAAFVDSVLSAPTAASAAAKEPSPLATPMPTRKSIPKRAEPKPRVPPEKASYDRRLFAIGLGAGFHWGGGARIRYAEALGLELRIGVVPALLAYKESTFPWGSEPKTKLIATPRLGVAPLIRVLGTATKRTQLWLHPAYSFDMDLGSGFGAGGVAQIRLSKHWSLDWDWGVSIFPNAEGRLEDRGVMPKDTNYNFPPGLSYGANIGISLLP